MSDQNKSLDCACACGKTTIGRAVQPGLVFRANGLICAECMQEPKPTYDTYTVQALCQIVRSLVRSREALSLELSYAKGLLDEMTFSEMIEPLVTPQAPVVNLTFKTAVLALVTGKRVDTGLVAAVFGCSYEDAQVALSAAFEVLRENKAP